VARKRPVDVLAELRQDGANREFRKKLNEGLSELGEARAYAGTKLSQTVERYRMSRTLTGALAASAKCPRDLSLHPLRNRSVADNIPGII